MRYRDPSGGFANQAGAGEPVIDSFYALRPTHERQGARGANDPGFALAYCTSHDQGIEHCPVIAQVDNICGLDKLIHARPIPDG